MMPATLDLAFDTAVQIIFRLEGGFANHASDPGGATNLGITRAALAGWRRVPITALSIAEVQALTREEAAAIYRASYWRAAGCEWIAAADRRHLALAHFDWAVNGGTGRARWYLQAALNLGAAAALTVDGILGPRSRAAVAALDDAGEAATVSAYLALRLAHYRLRAAATGGEQLALTAQLERAGLTRFLPAASEDARAWLPVWTRRLRTIAVASGLPVHALPTDLRSPTRT